LLRFFEFLANIFLLLSAFAIIFCYCILAHSDGKNNQEQHFFQQIFNKFFHLSPIQPPNRQSAASRA